MAALLYKTVIHQCFHAVLTVSLWQVFVKYLPAIHLTSDRITRRFPPFFFLHHITALFWEKTQGQCLEVIGKFIALYLKSYHLYCLSSMHTDCSPSHKIHWSLGHAPDKSSHQTAGLIPYFGQNQSVPWHCPSENQYAPQTP